MVIETELSLGGKFPNVRLGCFVKSTRAVHQAADGAPFHFLDAVHGDGVSLVTPYDKNQSTLVVIPRRGYRSGIGDLMPFLINELMRVRK